MPSYNWLTTQLNIGTRAWHYSCVVWCGRSLYKCCSWLKHSLINGCVVCDMRNSVLWWQLCRWLWQGKGGAIHFLILIFSWLHMVVWQGIIHDEVNIGLCPLIRHHDVKGKTQFSKSWALLWVCSPASQHDAVTVGEELNTCSKSTSEDCWQLTMQYSRWSWGKAIAFGKSLIKWVITNLYQFANCQEYRTNLA